MTLPKPTISINWLDENLENQDLVVLDASLPKPMTKAEDNPLSSIQIPGAFFFDIDKAFSDTSIDLPHMMPSASNFSTEARKLGINKSSRIVVYDNLGVYSSPRAWWMFRAMGHEEVTVLDGGLPDWVEARLPTENKKETVAMNGDFEAKPIHGFFKDANAVLEEIDSPGKLVLDARTKGRFEGSQPEPRAGLRGGHIPGSKCLPFTEVVAGNKLLPKEALQKKFDQLEITNQQLTFSCGSGLTACIIALAANIVGFKELSVYDGSWSEWGQPGDLPVTTG